MGKNFVENPCIIYNGSCQSPGFLSFGCCVINYTQE